MVSLLKHHPLPLFAAALIVPQALLAADLTFSPAALAFGGVALTESKTLTATFKNRSALAVNLTATQIEGANAAAFSQTHQCPQPLPAGASCVFTVKFKPAALTAQRASLNISTDDPAAPSVSLGLAGNTASAPLNDTGATDCGDLEHNGLPCPNNSFPGQDAEYGRDKLHPSDTNGHAGFNFTKLDATGKALPATATQWNCVRDNVTGLIWEKKPTGDGTMGNQGLHDADDSYTWYSTDSANNGGSVGYQNQGGTCYGYDAANSATYCNTEAYAKRVNKAGWCGKKDWRVPTLRELKGLADLGVRYPGPTLDKRYFPDIVINSWHWSSSPYAGISSYAWGVSFATGHSTGNSRSNRNSAIRLVRGGQ
jgi:hypothetical protein